MLKISSVFPKGIVSLRLSVVKYLAREAFTAEVYTYNR